MSRFIDIVASFVGLIILSPFIGIILLLVWRQDGYNPLYLADRIGKNKKPFQLIKIRSMVMGADSSGVESTSASDSRITPLGHFIRQYKLDELTQLWNVLIGEMSLVGPRPNTKSGISEFTNRELNVFIVKPGMTDFSSIIFSNEGEIIDHADDPDAAYDRLIRPWKSRLGLLYMARQSVWLDLQLVATTFVAIVHRPTALKIIAGLLRQTGAPQSLINLTRQNHQLEAVLPPGAQLQ